MEEKISANSQDALNKNILVTKFDKRGLGKSELSICRRSLSYWLDSECFDLPNIASKSVNGKVFESQLVAKKISLSGLKRNKDARVFFYICIHYADYMYDGYDRQPNDKDLKTCLLVFPMKPSISDGGSVRFYPMEDIESECVFNIAALRLIFKKKLVKNDTEKSLIQWIADHKSELSEYINGYFFGFEDEDLELSKQQGIPASVIAKKSELLNQEIFDKFFPSESSQSYMKTMMKSAGSFSERKQGHELGWSAFYCPKGDAHTQLGPFYAKDIEMSLKELESGSDGLSSPLKKMILGECSPFYLPVDTLIDQHEYYNNIPREIPKGFWPVNPKFGLTLLQDLAVRSYLSKKHGPNPIISVNGPPGTGKTTLLKEVIAHNFVERTKSILDSLTDDGSLFNFENGNLFDVVMPYSMVVTSSNNTAVENISKELPQLSGIYGDYLSHIGHFSMIAPKSDWGVFCGVLGKSENRKKFIQVLKSIKDSLYQKNDIFRLKMLSDKIEKNSSVRSYEKLIYEHFELLYLRGNFNLFDKMVSISSDKGDELSDQLKTLNHLLNKFKNNDFEIDGIEFGGSDEELKQVVGSLKDLKVRLHEQGFGKTYNDGIFEERKSNFLKLYSEVLTHVEKSSNLSYGFSSNAKLTNSDILKYIPNKEFVSDLRARLFCSACLLNESMLIQKSQDMIKSFEYIDKLFSPSGDLSKEKSDHAWACVFSFFPVISSTLASVQSQFSTLIKKETFGLVMIDESGQAVKSQVIGILQRTKKAIIVGDPIQVEPVYDQPSTIDRIAGMDYFYDDEIDHFLLSSGSVQTLADRANAHYSKIGERKVGIPLLVHRRCHDPMFSIANQIAYNDLMINANAISKDTLTSAWINSEDDIKADLSNISGYKNIAEANIAMNLLELIVEHSKEMAHEKVYIITPFKLMKDCIIDAFMKLVQTPAVYWIKELLPKENREEFNKNPDDRGHYDMFKDFARKHIGTIHTFQGKEAGTVIMCMSASALTGKSGGMAWFNEKPNMMNVALTRAKKRIFFVGSVGEWKDGLQTAPCIDSNEIRKFSSIHSYVEKCFKYKKIKKHSLLDKNGISIKTNNDNKTSSIPSIQLTNIDKETIESNEIINFSRKQESLVNTIFSLLLKKIEVPFNEYKDHVCSLVKIFNLNKTLRKKSCDHEFVKSIVFRYKYHGINIKEILVADADSSIKEGIRLNIDINIMQISGITEADKEVKYDLYYGLSIDGVDLNPKYSWIWPKEDREVSTPDSILIKRVSLTRNGA